jgi:hypothetical protein
VVFVSPVRNACANRLAGANQGNLVGRLCTLVSSHCFFAFGVT